MPMPRWWGQLNKRLFNPPTLRSGTHPVLTHVGRKSGTVYQTPLDAHSVEGGYLFILVYGSKADWVRNVLAAGQARVTIDGKDTDLVRPRLVDQAEAWSVLPANAKPPGLLRIKEYLRTDLAAG